MAAHHEIMSRSCWTSRNSAPKKDHLFFVFCVEFNTMRHLIQTSRLLGAQFFLNTTNINNMSTYVDIKSETKKRKYTLRHLHPNQHLTIAVHVSPQSKWCMMAHCVIKSQSTSQHGKQQCLLAIHHYTGHFAISNRMNVLTKGHYWSLRGGCLVTLPKKNKHGAM